MPRITRNSDDARNSVPPIAERKRGPWLMLRLPLFLSVCLFLPWALAACAGDGWRDARRDSAGIAPDPAGYDGAVVQIYAAAVYGWRGVVADHTWIAVKPRGAATYKRYEVIGWRLRRGRSVVAETSGAPDGYWYGSAPKLLVDIRGDQAQALIPRIADASACYPWPDRYEVWPGPNSNSYTQWIALVVPELALSLPWRAVGKNWMLENFDEDASSC